MAIAPTGDIFKGFEFDGESSKDYGVYITGEAVYNAPTRDVEMISIPGRNGAFALDGGRFENIEVTYPAGIFADDETNFAEAISDFRNYLCSRDGYVRLTDEYNPNEYRMAIYKSGLEVSPAQLKAGEFNIVFDCKPQRWLTSGEEKTTIADGDTITNPTLFESSPLLEVKGNGTISFNGYAIELDAGNMGYTEIEGPFQFTPPLTKQFTSALFNATDDIQTGVISVRWGLDVVSSFDGFSRITLGRSSTGTPADVGDGTTVAETVFDRVKPSARVVTTFPIHLFSGSSATTMTDVATAMFVTYTPGAQFQVAMPVTTTITVTYTPSTKTLSVGVNGVIDWPTGLEGTVAFVADTSHCNSVYAYSTVNVLGNPTYIDCDLGEAYKIEGGSYISLNSHIDLGSDLPKLAKGSNIISVDSSVTELKLIPKWWKI